jgi:hypothetical protein
MGVIVIMIGAALSYSKHAKPKPLLPSGAVESGATPP